METEKLYYQDPYLTAFTARYSPSSRILPSSFRCVKNMSIVFPLSCFPFLFPFFINSL